MRKKLEQSGCGQLAAYMVPFARRDVLEIVADFLMWNISFDDDYCDEGPLGKNPGQLASMLSHIQRSIESPEVPLYIYDKYAAALRDIRARLDACSRPANVDRWVEGMRVWFLAEVWRAGNEERGVMLSLDDYAVMRMWCGGAYAFLALGPIAEGYELTATEQNDRRIRALFEIAATLCNWAADIIGHLRDGRDEGGE
ncbi:hypothetical protein WS67_22420 [Burkholderia singularis]|uniref:Uncharacterized protein n=2 Tax=Burkholderia singularis TaxID=1503053 RepID=A0A118DLL3_9BURK|nr:hypothetical protein WS67_22420 [Burkholderia singularis]